MVIKGPVRRGPNPITTLRRNRAGAIELQRSGMTATELRAKLRAVPTGGLFFRLLTR
jgi:hypothetical protein